MTTVSPRISLWPPPRQKGRGLEFHGLPRGKRNPSFYGLPWGKVMGLQELQRKTQRYIVVVQPF